MRRETTGLLACLLLTASTAAAQQSSDLVVHAAVFYQSASACGGDTAPVQIEAEPNPTGGIHVGFFESSAGAIGEQMNASGWLSALVSAELLDSDLRDYRISYNWSGLIDGPSAGGLMTSGILSLLLGDPFPGDATMTGTINPDGTIGPVGGIAQKIEGVAAAGFARLAIPLGNRESYNVCSGEVEDMLEVGRRHGVEVAEVGDIREAYAFLTGATLPQPLSRSVSQDIPEDLRRDFRLLYDAWLARYEAARRIVSAARPKDFPKEFRTLWRDGEKFLASSQRELQSGHEPAAFNRIWTAVLNAEFVARSVVAMQALNNQGFPGLHGVVGQALTESKRRVSAGLEALRDIQIVSIVDAGAVASIGILVSATLAYLDQAEAELSAAQRLTRNAKPAEFEEIGKLSFQALAHAGLSTAVLDLALANKGWIGRDSRPWQRNAAPINAGRDLYRAAARSNLRYVDTLHTAEVAEKRKMDMASAQAWVKREDPIYLAASGGLDQQFAYFDLFSDDYVAAVAQMGALMGSVANAAVLVAKYYSIGAETDELGRVTGLRRQAALQKMMALAEAAAEQAIGEANAATDGASTPMLLVALDVARRNRDETVTPQDQLTALAYFWGTTMNARLMTKLARSN